MKKSRTRGAVATVAGSTSIDLVALAEHVEAFASKTVVVLGDFVADEFQFGEISRVSREAPVLILRHRETQLVPGGGANAANNFAALGAKVLRLYGSIAVDAHPDEEEVAIHDPAEYAAAALKAMLGQSVSQTFTYGSNTEFLKWSKGIPSVVQAGDLAAGQFCLEFLGRFRELRKATLHAHPR